MTCTFKKFFFLSFNIMQAGSCTNSKGMEAQSVITSLTSYSVKGLGKLSNLTVAFEWL